MVGEGRLRKGLGNEFALLVLEVREVTGRFLLGKGSSLSKTLLVPPLDDLGDALKRAVSRK